MLQRGLAFMCLALITGCSQLPPDTKVEVASETSLNSSTSAKSTETTLVQLRKQALLQAQGGQMALALENFTKILQIDSSKFSDWQNRATANDALGNYEAAIQDYDKALELAKNTASNTEVADLYTNLCGSNIQLEQYQKASSACSEAIRLYPEGGRAYTRRAYALALEMSVFEVSSNSTGKKVNILRENDPFLTVGLNDLEIAEKLFRQQGRTDLLTELHSVASIIYKRSESIFPEFIPTQEFQRLKAVVDRSSKT
ncbi:tetratricopeptide repeat protein [Trichocoleus desertorum AS-A10]|uniref:tetratricopeptide repeat protein n=1 Tax=Trichocoleus desertorum TaxID=1481672 RepID=UPI00329860C6